ncbi:hypothetical protein GQ457_04G004620 [Hibiscus cannabinus]
MEGFLYSCQGRSSGSVLEITAASRHCRLGSRKIGRRSFPRRNLHFWMVFVSIFFVGWVLEGGDGGADLPLLLLIPCRTPFFSNFGSDCFPKRLIHVDGDDGASLTSLLSPAFGSLLGDIVSRCQVCHMPIEGAEDRFSFSGNFCCLLLRPSPILSSVPTSSLQIWTLRCLNACRKLFGFILMIVAYSNFFLVFMTSIFCKLDD